jgi:hypothetical protein
MIQSAVLTTEEDDLTGLSGWMYTDLLLALVVVFLATITFVPNLDSFGRGGIASGDSIFSYSKTIEKPLNLLIEDQQIPDIPALIEGFKSQEGISPSAVVVYLQIVGSYNDRMEVQSDAVSRALTLSQILDQQYPELFQAAATTFSTTNTIPSNQVVVRIIFAERVLISKN